MAWTDQNNWDPNILPVDTDDVLITNGATVVLAADSPLLDSFTITNSTLIFTNWTTRLRATVVTIENGGVLDLPDGFTESGTSNRIHVVCSNFTMEAGGLIDADEGGFLATFGPGGGRTADRTRGAGYGGRGGMGQTVDDTGYTYGSASAPLACGSGGGSTGEGGAGGGAVRIEADGTVTIDGTISANGQGGVANYGGGGSGGGVYITCDTLAGAGLIRVNGGAGVNVGGRGAGGRIALSYNDAGASWPGLRCQASPATTGYSVPEPYLPKPGTVWFSDTTVLAELLNGNVLTDVVAYFGSGDPWSANSLTVSNNSFRIGSDGFVVNINGDVRIDTGAEFDVPNLNCSGSVLVTNGGVLGIHAGPTNGVVEYGALLAVTNDLTIGPGSTLLVESHPTNGASPLIRVSNLVVAATGEISGDGRGYQGVAGPGAGDAGERRAGGGHGGYGGHGTYATLEGAASGTAEPPIGPGSGGGLTHRGGFGGALVRIEAADTVTVHGTIRTDGSRYGNGYGGGGAGGGIWIDCDALDGSAAGLLQANGGDGTSNVNGGGGGGRIAVVYNSASPWPGVRFASSPGQGRTSAFFPFEATGGSVFLSDDAVLDTLIDGDQFTDVSLVISNFDAWAVDSLTVSNSSFRFGLTNFALYVTNNLLVGANGYLGVVDVECHNDVIVTNGGELEVFANATNGTGRDFGAIVIVSNDVIVGDSSTLYVRSAKRDGGSVRLEVNGVSVAENGVISADSRGFEGYHGPGKGDSSSRRRGGGYGGRGGQGDQGGSGGLTYGSTNAPTEPGSGGCYNVAAANIMPGGFGGGLIFIDAVGVVNVDGTLTANGGRYGGWGYSGGGSGGGILVLCDSFLGDLNGVVRADGGDGQGNAGGGGGGRISVAIGLSDADETKLLDGDPISGLSSFATHSEYLGLLSVTGGTGWANALSLGGNGSQVFLSTALALTVQGNPIEADSPSPDGYGTAADKSGGDSITNTVTSPADELAGERWVCLGWELTNAAGDVISNEVYDTQAIFTITQNVFLTWHWTNQWELAVSAGPNGSVNSGAVNGWYTNGVQVTNINPTADGGYFFSQWVGDVPAGKENDDPLTVTMDQARTLQASFASLAGETKYWSGSGAWETPGNWSPSGLPSKYDTAIITNGTVVFSVSRDVRNLVISNGAEMVFTNWDAVLTVSNDVLVEGTISLPNYFTESDMSNRVQIVCSNFTLAANGVIDADSSGFAGQNGPGKGVSGTRGAGGGHGGVGGWGSVGELGGVTYDLTNAPSMPGSGGGEPGGGPGGGVIRIDAEATAMIDGTISANGGDGTSGEAGGGSGGAIWVSCDTFDGSNGLIRAIGGEANNVAHGGSGGGGRVAVTYNSLEADNSVRFDLGISRGFANYYDIERFGVERDAGDGTLYLPDLGLLDSSLTDGRFIDLVLHVGNTSTWAVADLVVSNTSVHFADEDFMIDVANDVRVDADGELGVQWLNCGGALVLTNGGTLSMYSGPTNGTGMAYGSLLDVADGVAIGPGSWLYTFSDDTDGGSPKLEMDSLYVATNGGVQASGRGFADNTGPGTGGSGSSGRGGGAGYGGEGGEGSTGGSFGGPTYGPTNSPGWAGSGGGGNRAGKGGGVIWIRVTDTVELDGTLQSDGREALALDGGGSGGSVWVDCWRFSGGSDGLVRAGGGRGNSSHGGGGGGGRIAVWWGLTTGDRQAILADPDNPNVVPRLSVTNEPVANFHGTVTATNGLAGYEAGQPGTIIFLNVLPPAGTIIIVR